MNGNTGFKSMLILSLILFYPYMIYSGYLDFPIKAPEKIIKTGMEVSKIDFDQMWYEVTSNGYNFPSQPGFGDVDGDGYIEVVVFIENEKTRFLACLNSLNGSLKWVFENKYKVFFSPLVIDTDGDGKGEIVAGDNAGNIFLLDGLNGSLIWNISVEGALKSSIIPYMIGKEVFFAFGTNKSLYSVDRSGNVNWAFPTNSSVRDITIGYVNDDKVMDVIGIDKKYNIYVLDGTTGDLIWAKELRQVSGAYLGVKIYFGDFDRDGTPNILVVGLPETILNINAKTGEILWETTFEGRIPGAIGDVDNDGKLEYVSFNYKDIVTVDLSNGNTYIYRESIDTNIQGLILGDFDGDPNLEILAPLAILDFVNGVWIPIYDADIGDYWTYYAYALDVSSDSGLVLFSMSFDYDSPLIASKPSSFIPFRVYWNGLYGDVNGSKSLDYIDPDGDLLSTSVEVLLGSKFHVSDTDGDGISDGWEVKYGLDPLIPDDSSRDLDNDGLTNLEEYRHSTNPLASDSDFDGLSDGFEVSLSFNPRDPADPLYTWILLSVALIMIVWGYKEGLFTFLKQAFIKDWQRLEGRRVKGKSSSK